MLKPRKNQKCRVCKKILTERGGWAFNGHWWCGKCKDKDSALRIKKYLKNYEPK